MIYLDNSATTEIDLLVREAMLPYLSEEYGNPSSKYYKKATNAKKAVENAREQVAKLINAKPEEIIFTSGATESTNLAIKGMSDYKKLYEKKGNHIITSKAEHKATLNVCKFLNGDIYSNSDSKFSLFGDNPKVDRGYEVDFLDVNEYGQVCVEDFQNTIKNTTTLASIIWGNNEIASLNDIKSLGEVCSQKGIIFHTDATQCIGKIDVNVQDSNIDLMSFSGHKISAPKGIGALYFRSDDYGLPPMSAFLHGGEQESGLRGSTYSVHNIVGFGKACEIYMKRKKEESDKLYESHREIMKFLNSLENIKLLGDIDRRVPFIYSIAVLNKDFNNERFIKKVSSNYAVSTGSACSLGEPSHVLEACGLSDYTNKVIRLSGRNTADIKKFITFLQDEIS